MSPITVYPPEATVVLTCGIEATVTGVQVRAGGAVSYEVVWWDGRERHCEVITPGEVRGPAPADAPGLRIGFREATRR